MKLTLRMRITILTGVVIMAASMLLTLASIYTAGNKIDQVVSQAAVLTVNMRAINKSELQVGRHPIEGIMADMQMINHRPPEMIIDRPKKVLESKQVGMIVKYSENIPATAGKPMTLVKFTDGEPMPTLEPEQVQAVELENLTEVYATPAQNANNEFKHTSLWVMAIITVMGMLISYYLAGKALKPVYRLNKAILNISEDNLKERLPETEKKDEIESLTGSFNAMLDRLEDSFWRQKRFSSNAAHELKTPLATMKTGMQVLELSESPTIEEYKELLDITAKNINRLSTVVDGLLVLANEGYKDEVVSISLNSLFSDLVSELSPLCEKNQISLEFSGTEASFCIAGNEILTYRLFYNLIENAIKYNIPQGKIKIAVVRILSKEDGGFIVTVEDTGMGMENDQLKQIFEPFYCVNPSRSRKLGGAGLGLSIVRDIADRYGWKIKVDSTKGIGTIFQVTMPVSLDF